jgi:hypothetical protein
VMVVVVVMVVAVAAYWCLKLQFFSTLKFVISH